MYIEIEPDDPFRVACEKVLAVFYDRVAKDGRTREKDLPRMDKLKPAVQTNLQTLIRHCAVFEGKPEAWAGGLVYATNNLRGEEKVILHNAVMEEALGTSMNTIRKRANQVNNVIGPHVTSFQDVAAADSPKTLRDETDAISDYQLKGDVLRRYADPKDPLDEKGVERLLSERLAELRSMKASRPDDYRQFLEAFMRRHAKEGQRRQRSKTA